MVSQTTQDFVFSLVDAQNEYNTKFFLFCVFIFYMIFSLWWANKIIPWKATADERKKFPVYQQISVKLMRVFPGVFFFFTPLAIGIFSYREYALDSLLTLMVTGYSVVSMILLGIWLLFGMGWVQDLLALAGIQTKDKKGRMIRRRPD